MRPLLSTAGRWKEVAVMFFCTQTPPKPLVCVSRKAIGTGVAIQQPNLLELLRVNTRSRCNAQLRHRIGTTVCIPIADEEWSQSILGRSSDLGSMREAKLESIVGRSSGRYV